MQKIVIKSKQDSIVDAIGGLLNGGLFIAIAIYAFNKNRLLSVLLMCISIRMSIYQMIDLWVDKTFFIENGKVYVKCWGVKFRVNRERSFLRIDNMLVLSPINAKFPTLNIYRNPSCLLCKVFKNRIKLYTVTKDNIEDVRKEAHRISEMLGIPFKDVYRFIK